MKMNLKVVAAVISWVVTFSALTLAANGERLSESELTAGDVDQSQIEQENASILSTTASTTPNTMSTTASTTAETETPILPIIIAEGTVYGIFVPLKHTTYNDRAVWQAVDEDGNLIEGQLFYRRRGWNFAKDSGVTKDEVWGYIPATTSHMPPDGSRTNDWYEGSSTIHYAKAPYFTTCRPKPIVLDAFNIPLVIGGFDSLMACVESHPDVAYLLGGDGFQWDQHTGKCLMYWGYVMSTPQPKEAGKWGCILGANGLRISTPMPVESVTWVGKAPKAVISDCYNAVRREHSKAAGAALKPNGECNALFGIDFAGLAYDENSEEKLAFLLVEPPTPPTPQQP